MPTIELSLIAFFGAVVGDLMTLAAAMRTGRIDSKRWKRPITYVGMMLQGLIACLVLAVLPSESRNPVFAFSIGANLPLMLEKLAAISPKLSQPALPRESGFSDAESEAFGSSLENFRQLLAKER